MQIDYRLRIYDDDGTTVLTPRAGSVHSDPFQVASVAGVTGYQPYLDIPRGKSGELDLLQPKVSIGSWNFEVMDKRTTEGGSNLSRWVTAFVGDEKGLPNLIGKKAVLEERVDLGSWTAIVTGVVGNCGIGRAREWISFTVKENAERLKAKVFGARPHPSVTYADGHSLLPYGPSIDFGGFDATPLVPGTVKAWSKSGYGSGFAVIVDRASIDTADGRVEVAKVFQPLLDAVGDVADDQLLLSTVHCDLYSTSDVLIGSFQLGSIPKLLIAEGGAVVADFGRRFIALKNDGEIVEDVGIAELDPEHPRYAAMPLDGTAVKFRLVNAGEPAEDAPIHVASSSPIDFLADVLDGKFSPPLTDLTGAIVAGAPPSLSIDRDAAAFAAIGSARPFATGRWVIDGPMKVNEFLEELLGAPHRIGYRFDGDGELVPLDIRIPTSLAGVATITNADLVTDPPGWEIELDNAISEVRVKHYSDNQDRPYTTVSGLQLVKNKPTWIGEAQHVTTEFFDNPGRGRGDPYEVDAVGFRHTLLSTETAADLQNIGSTLYAQARVKGLIQDLRTLFSGALAGMPLMCRRTANTSTCLPGDLRIIDVDEIPDAATNLRGGPRVAMCIEREPQGEQIRLVFADLGANLVAVSPTLGAVALVAGGGTQAAKVPVTLNASSEPAVVGFAVTPTSTGTRPAESSDLWQFGVRLTATGDGVVQGLPSGMRVWFRGRSEPGGQQLKIPSGWVFPSGTGRVDTTGITAPSGLVKTVVGSDCFVDFTPGDADLATEMWLNDGTGWGTKPFNTLPPGSTRAPYRNLAAGAYTAGLQHRDDRGGASSRTTIAFTIGALGTSPAMVGVTLIVGEAG